MAQGPGEVEEGPTTEDIRSQIEHTRAEMGGETQTAARLGDGYPKPTHAVDGGL